MKNIAHRIIVIATIFYLGNCDFQNYLLYYPSKQKPFQNSLAAFRIEFWGCHLDDYRGYISTIPIPNPRGTIIVFHGNAGSAFDRIYYLQALAPLGYRVILAEYPGYGGREGELGETGFVSDAKETVRLAFEQYGKRIYLLGESLGCGVAAAAAKNLSVQIDGIILITPWDSLLSIAKEKFPWLPVRLLLKDKYDSIENLKAFQGKIAVIGAEYDEVIPINHAYALHQALPSYKRMWVIKHAGHNNWHNFVDSSWWQSVINFIEERNKQSGT